MSGYKNRMSSTPQWKYLMQRQVGIDVGAPKEVYYTGEVVDVPKEQFVEIDGEMRNTGNYPDEMRGKRYRVMGIGNVDRSAISMLSTIRNQEKPAPKNTDPGPQQTIRSSHWKSGHWKVAKLILKKDMDRADKEWMTFGSKRAYRQYKLIEQFLEEKSQQNWEPDDDFATKYLIEFRRAFSDSMNIRVDWERRREALATIQLIRDELKLPTYNKL